LTNNYKLIEDNKHNLFIHIAATWLATGTDGDDDDDDDDYDDW